MTDIFEEVEENLRHERMLGVLKKWGPWFVGAFAALLVGILGVEGWRDFQIKQAGQFTLDLRAAGETAASTQDIETAKAAYQALAKKSGADRKAVAEMRLADLLVRQNDLAGALKAMDAAAKAAKQPEFRDIARLKAAYLAADLEGLSAVEPRLKLLIDEGGQFSFLARELLGFEALRVGDQAKARDQFAFLRDSLEAPEAMRQRATAALAGLDPEPVKPIQQKQQADPAK